MDLTSLEQIDMQSLLEKKQQIEKEWANLLALKREVEAKARHLDSMERQFDLKWSMLITETQKLAEEQKNFDRKKEFYSRVNQHEEVKRAKAAAQNTEMFFSGVSSQQALKKRYKDLIKIYHPDSESGDNETVQEINREYDSLKQRMTV